MIPPDHRLAGLLLPPLVLLLASACMPLESAGLMAVAMWLRCCPRWWRSWVVFWLRRVGYELQADQGDRSAPGDADRLSHREVGTSQPTDHHRMEEGEGDSSMDSACGPGATGDDVRLPAGGKEQVQSRARPPATAPPWRRVMGRAQDPRAEKEAT